MIGEGEVVSKSLKLAIAGLGTVGAGVVKIIQDKARELEQRTGREFVLTAVSARNKDKDRGVDLSAYQWFDDAVKMAANADADVFVELIGGEDGIALQAVETALSNGRHVVTANKALLAKHGAKLARAAEAKGLGIGYESAVAGGIPIIKSMREGLAGNHIDRVYGILNGTCNYILTTMEATGRDFVDVLSEAQAEGYAEADPTFDVGGIDTAHKLSLLASVSFGNEVDFDSVFIEGIDRIGPEDIAYAQEFGYRIKLIGVAQRTDHGIEQRVHPCLVPLSAPIASVSGVYNAVVVEGDEVGQTTYEGRGAGQGPTASAVVGDLVDLARGLRQPVFLVPADQLGENQPASMDNHKGAYYLRLRVIDQPGVLAAVTVALAEGEISVDSMVQRGRAPGEPVSIVIVTHETTEAVMKSAIAKINGLDAVTEPTQLIRIEKF